jgi:hypothetical protein
MNSGEEYRESQRKRNKIFYSNNEEKVKKKHKCMCGGVFTYFNKSKHIKTKRHLSFLKNL